MIERNARSQSAIIEDLLDMSAIISGKARLNVERVDAGMMLRAAIDTARPGADAKHIRIVTSLQGADGLVLHGDPNRLQQVMSHCETSLQLLLRKQPLLPPAEWGRMS